MLFWLFRTFLQSLFISNATNPPFTLGLAITFWKAVAPDGKEPPIEKVIAMIALNVNNRMYN